jgi:HK97 gp10 family phage protein
MAVTWIKPPSTIARTLAQRTAGMQGALNANAQAHASKGESAMRANAPWNDRTGFARASLTGQAEGTDVVLGTTNSEYGIYLELGTSKMAARPIIVPTANEIAPEYFRTSADIVRRLLGGG